MVDGQWSIVDGWWLLWTIDYGPSTMDNGPWTIDYFFRFLSKNSLARSNTLRQLSYIKNP